MKLTPEQLRQNAAAMIAFADGKPVEYKYRDPSCEDRWDGNPSPSWDCDAYYYRPKPEPVRRPWSKRSDVAAPWLKLKTALQDDFITHILTVDDTGVRIIGESGIVEFATWKELSECNAHFSPDLQDWKPCTVEEGQP